MFLKKSRNKPLLQTMAQFNLILCCLSVLFYNGQCSKISKRSDDSGPMETVVSQLSQTVATLTARLQTAETFHTDINSRLTTISSAQGSTYVRWGRTQCPNGVTTIYSGVAAGGHTDHTGTGANRLCMVMNPVLDNTPILDAHGSIYGAQYFFSGDIANDVTCSLCYTTFSTTFIVPGTNRCPSGTTEQYHGYLTSGFHKSFSASEYLCLDSNPEDRPGSSADIQGAWFEKVSTECGCLPCPPYSQGKAATCAVCSK